MKNHQRMTPDLYHLIHFFLEMHDIIGMVSVLDNISDKVKYPTFH